MNKALTLTLALLVALGCLSVAPSPASAANRNDYPHVGEVVGYKDVDKWLGSTSKKRPKVMWVGDSISYRAVQEKRIPTSYEVSAVPGRNIENLGWYIKDRLKSKAPLTHFVMALGTNSSLPQNYTYNNLRDDLNLLPKETKVVLVSSGKYGAAFRDGSGMIYRGLDSSSKRYADWFEILNSHYKTCVARWRQVMFADPSLVSRDGVHPDPGRGTSKWVSTVTNAMKTCA